MDRNLALEFVRVTENAAIASAKWMGRGNEKQADQSAVSSMRKDFNRLNIDGTIVIGEGERDEAPMLFIGEKVGSGANKIKVDIAVDPLEGTTITAKGGLNAISVLAASPQGTMLQAPDTYMNKIAVGEKAKDAIDLDKSIEENINAVAEKLEKEVHDITVMILERERHKNLIEDVRKSGARIRLIQDGDISGAISPAIEDSGIDILMGIGGAPEGVIAAAALKTLGGEIQGRLNFRNKDERKRAEDMGFLDDVDKKLKMEDMIKGKVVVFAATGVTNGEILKGIRFIKKGAITHSIVMRSKSGTIRFIEAHHNFKNQKI